MVRIHVVRVTPRPLPVERCGDGEHHEGPKHHEQVDDAEYEPETRAPRSDGREDVVENVEEGVHFRNSRKREEGKVECVGPNNNSIN